MSVNYSSVSRNNNSDWQWREWEGLPYLTCELLANWSHGFFTQHYYPDTPETLVKVFDSAARVNRVKQVHGNRVLTPKEIKSEITVKSDHEAARVRDRVFPDADGIVSDAPQQSVWVASADCNPVLIGDIATGRVAAIHAGWRGTAQKIVPNAIARMQTTGSNLEDLRVAMGAAIAGEVYQVTEAVAAEVGRSILQVEEETKREHDEAVSEIVAMLFELTDSPLIEDSEAGKVRLDVRKVNAIQLKQLGILPEQIAIAPYCTYQQPESWFSFRRTSEKKVQWSGIVGY